MSQSAPRLPIVPVILSGGGGTRLWPMSTPDRPKQFLSLTAEETMFQLTVQRTRDEERFAAPIIVSGAGHAAMVEGQLQAIDVLPHAIILEPCARNTAPAIALAALAAPDPKSPLLVMPSDHVITDVAAFRAAITAAEALLDDGWLCTFGIAPTGPETGYGYIRMGEALSQAVQRVARFVEKPDLETAKTMLASGDHVWNGGIFLFRADMFLGALASHAPDILHAAQAAMADARRDGAFIHPEAGAFAASPSDSIDYAVMEKAERVAVAPVSMGWSDIGSWDALFDLDASASSNGVLAIDTANCLFRTDGLRIHAIGVEDLIVVASGNDLLIVPRGKSQDVRKIVEALNTKR